MDRIWDTLQIDEGADKKEIKKAYARLSREIHPEEKPEEFQRLYEAYQKALRYASCREKKKAGGMSEINPAAESVPGVEKRGKYEQFGLHAEDVQQKKLRLERIKRFLDEWDEESLVCGQTGEFLTESRKIYMQSDEFAEIKWSPMVMEVIAEGVLKYSVEEEILSFFENVYGLKIRGTGDDRENRQLIYRDLYPAYMKKERRQEIQGEWLRIEKVRYFQICWKEQMTVWENGGLFLSEDWKRYLESSEFWEIMWIPRVLRTVAEGVSWCFTERWEISTERAKECARKQKILLFFWELYRFEELGEANCKGESLLLYKRLYPAYTNRVKRELYKENKGKILREECWYAGKAVLVCMGAFMSVRFVVEIIPWEILFLILITIVLGALTAYGQRANR